MRDFLTTLFKIAVTAAQSVVYLGVGLVLHLLIKGPPVDISRVDSFLIVTLGPLVACIAAALVLLFGFALNLRGIMKAE